MEIAFTNFLTPLFLLPSAGYLSKPPRARQKMTSLSSRYLIFNRKSIFFAQHHENEMVEATKRE